jgi:hypothetical protein
MKQLLSAARRIRLEQQRRQQSAHKFVAEGPSPVDNAELRH